MQPTYKALKQRSLFMVCKPDLCACQQNQPFLSKCQYPLQCCAVSSSTISWFVSQASWPCHAMLPGCTERLLMIAAVCPLLSYLPSIFCVVQKKASLHTTSALELPVIDPSKGGEDIPETSQPSSPPLTDLRPGRSCFKHNHAIKESITLHSASHVRSDLAHVFFDFWSCC